MYIDWYFAESDGRLKRLAGAVRVYRWEKRLASLWPAMKDAFRSWIARDLLRQDFEGMSDNELADIGLSRAEIPAIVKAYPTAGRLQRRMMTRLGLDLGQAVDAWPAVMRAVGRACAKCGERKRCERWLESCDANESYRAFCPNGYRFAAVKVWQARRNARS